MINHSKTRPKSRCCGVTLLELMIVVIVLGILGAVGNAVYTGYVARAKITKAIADIGILSLEIAKFELRTGGLPDTLADLGMDPSMLTDPYGNAYRYLNLALLRGVGGARKDHNNVEINRDYDLYSMGKDGVTNQTFTATAAQDDIVRGASGGFIGTPADYSTGPGRP